MTSLARILANRRNAKLSTGPKTRSGKKRSSRNAHRHGLAATLEMTTEQNAFIANLTEALSLEATTREQRILARQIAEQEYHVIQARYVRRALLSNGCLRMAVEERRARSIPTKKAFRMITKAQDFYMLSQVRPVEDTHGIMHLFQIAKLAFFRKSLPLSDGFKLIQTKLLAVDRYERRAVSRRNALIRKFTAMSASDLRQTDLPDRRMGARQRKA